MADVRYLDYSLISNWPPLAWLARIQKSNARVRVFHGGGVELADDWFCEAVWDGDFADGGFDRTDIVAGSGGRLRDGRLTFVSSGSTVDRLNSLELEDSVWVSNSLACLFAALGVNVDPTYPNYFYDFKSVIYGLNKYRRHVKTPAGPAQLTYFDNLVWDGDNLRRIRKPGANRDFSAFSRYRAFLEGSLLALSENMASSRRKRPYNFLGTLSCGYDSTAITALARKSGCREALCVSRGRDGDEDDGAAIAARLSVKPLRIQRDAWRSLELPEAPFIGADAKGEDVFFKGAESLLTGRVLLTGFHGDKMWAKRPDDLSENIVRGDQSGLDLTEYRLQVGFIHCPIAFWGVRQIRDINLVSNSPEMKPWDVPGEYSRPICRRVVEEAGVPREMFGFKKMVASVLLTLSDQCLSPRSQEDYYDWLRRNRKEWVRRWRLPAIHYRHIDSWEKVGRRYLISKCRDKRLLWRISDRLDYAPTLLRRHVFPWAIERVKKSYRSDLLDIPTCRSRASAA